MMALASRPTADFLYVRWMGPDRSIVDFSRIQMDRSRVNWRPGPVCSGNSPSRGSMYMDTSTTTLPDTRRRRLATFRSCSASDRSNPSSLGEQMTLF